MTLVGRAIGFAFFTYDYSTEILYGNYIAVEEHWRRGLAIRFIDRTMAVLAELFPKYRGVVFEVEKIDRERVNHIIQYLERQKPAQPKFEKDEDRDQIRQFLRIVLYQHSGCQFFKERGHRDPLPCTSPCLDPEEVEVENWSSEEDDYWIMWYKRPEIKDESDINNLWKSAIQCIYMEVLAKSLVEAYPAHARDYWEYASRTVQKSLDRAHDVVLAPYLSRQDDEAGIHAGSNHRLKNMAQDVAVAEAAMAINRERRVIGNLVVEIKPTEPAVGQMQLNLLTQPPLKANAVAVANDQHPDHKLGINRRPANIAIEECQFLA
jgi:hypothetical protein